ncbi:hypothetical protein Y032_0252g219 [Ancylostoma ceylanicum]|uniref:Uncharacterized protein n=1 Tax=Ancylostoma ceylanicum TaxID=53326 RepID=A0A016SBS0_9BILA|nr:hypothetical protein Y032_0252g219 [Ancylostoma ceylanicum]
MSSFSLNGKTEIVNWSKKMAKKGFMVIPRINRAFLAADFFPICVANKQSDTRRKSSWLALLARFVKMKFLMKLTVCFRLWLQPVCRVQ